MFQTTPDNLRSLLLSIKLQFLAHGVNVSWRSVHYPLVTTAAVESDTSNGRWDRGTYHHPYCNNLKAISPLYNCPATNRTRGSCPHESLLWTRLGTAANCCSVYRKVCNFLVLQEGVRIHVFYIQALQPSKNLCYMTELFIFFLTLLTVTFSVHTAAVWHLPESLYNKQNFTVRVVIHNIQPKGVTCVLCLRGHMWCLFKSVIGFNGQT